VTPEPSVGPTSSACLEELLACGVAAVRQAAAFALNPGEELRVEAKAHRNDLVTQVDRGVEERIAGHLEATGVPIHGAAPRRGRLLLGANLLFCAVLCPAAPPVRGGRGAWRAGGAKSGAALLLGIRTKARSAPIVATTRSVSIFFMM